MSGVRLAVRCATPRPCSPLLSLTTTLASLLLIDEIRAVRVCPIPLTVRLRAAPLDFPAACRTVRTRAQEACPVHVIRRESLDQK